jgi:hypothetical protein
MHFDAHDKYLSLVEQRCVFYLRQHPINIPRQALMEKFYPLFPLELGNEGALACSCVTEMEALPNDVDGLSEPGFRPREWAWTGDRVANVLVSLYSVLSYFCFWDGCERQMKLL